jgi:quercetin dioxygenase-like cupin family protein
MRLTISFAALLLVAAASTACAQQPTASEHTARASSASKSVPDASSASRGPELQWGPAPAIFPPGAQMAVLQGNPGGSDLFTVRLRFPNGYRIAPHSHPTDENVTVISGTFLVGMGETARSAGMMKLKAGGFVTAPANHAHYASAQGPTVVQVHAMGPFAMTYVNPADTPSAAKP